MSAKMEKFFELKKVVDHDCGNYQIGEIDFVNLDDIRKYILQHDSFGFDQLSWYMVRIMTAAQEQLLVNRQARSGQGSASLGAEVQI